MRRKIISMAVSLASCLLSSASNSSAPIDYEQYTLDTTAANALFTAVCPSGFTCSITATDDGFLQRTLFDGTGSYMQTLIADKKADLSVIYSGQSGMTFSQLEYVDEMFIDASGAQGVARKTRVAELGTAVTSLADLKFGFESNDTHLNGAFWTATDAAAGKGTEEVYQVISNAQGDGSNATDFFVSFDFLEIKTDAGGSVADAGRRVNLKQLVGEDAGKLVMAHTSLRGSQVSRYVSGSLSIGGNTVDTQVGDEDFNVIWVAQSFAGIDEFGLEKAHISQGTQPRIEGNKVDMTSVGFSGTVALDGFGWDDSLGTGVYAPSF